MRNAEAEARRTSSGPLLGRVYPRMKENYDARRKLTGSLVALKYDRRLDRPETNRLGDCRAIKCLAPQVIDDIGGV